MSIQTVPAAAIAAFRCPRCQAVVRSETDGLICGEGHVTPWRNGYLDASDGTSNLDHATKWTQESFGYEWTQFAAINPEDGDFWQRYFADVDLAALKECLALDAGCGKGRFSRFTAAHVATLVAVDNSEAVSAAAANLAELANTCVVRADLRRLPFPSGSFGFISCLGVLHHLSDPAAGLATLSRLLAPGGLLLVYLYSRPETPGVRALGLRGAATLRRITVGLPKPLLRRLCRPLAAFLYGTVVVPGRLGDQVGARRLSALPLATYRGAPLRSLWLDTFDRLSAPLEARFTPSEVASMLDVCGLTVKAVRSNPRLAGILALAAAPS
jgi:SAM-dependent methyltransferase